MTIRINNIKISLDDDLSKVKKLAAKLCRIDENYMRNYRILRESIDARKKNNIQLVYHVEFESDKESKIVSKANSKDIILEENKAVEELEFGSSKLNGRPIIVGSGPAGLFAGLIMARSGYNPIILERGGSVEERSEKINRFWQTGILDTQSNVQFGEGGAGTFSDGKLTTRIKDKRCDYVLEEFVKSGAPPEIIYSGKPHIGTDILIDVVRNIRNEIIKLGGEVRFNSKVTDVMSKSGKVTGVRVNNEYDIPCDVAIFAIGHSSRDTYEMLYSNGLHFEQKPFAIGVRIEHLQSMIDENQYGKYASHPKLRAADYRLAYTSAKYERACYTFCMCPGGVVVAAASEENRVVTNGMSEYARDKDNANSAVVVGVGPGDFKTNHPLAGIEFQRHYEALAYKVGGGNYVAPVQLVGDFLEDRISRNIGKVKPSYTRGYEFKDLRQCLPDYVSNVLKEGLTEFDRKIRGFASFDAVMTGIETRTSAPVRIKRGEKLESTEIKGIYPSGEGAGYAGGIVSAAVDGLRVAETIMQKYAPLSR
jgi:uncharacterized protein